MIVRMVSTAQTGYFYTTQRLRLGPRLAAVKYDPRGASVYVCLSTNSSITYTGFLWNSEEPRSVCREQEDLEEVTPPPCHSTHSRKAAINVLAPLHPRYRQDSRKACVRVIGAAYSISQHNVLV